MTKQSYRINIGSYFIHFQILQRSAAKALKKEQSNKKEKKLIIQNEH